MIQMQSLLEVADNSGAKTVLCIKVLGGSHKMIANAGDVVVVSVKDAIPHSKIKKGEVCRALIVRTKCGVRRKDGASVKFDSNAVVLLDKQDYKPLGTRVFGPVVRELREKNFTSVTSLAEEVL